MTLVFEQVDAPGADVAVVGVPVLAGPPLAGPPGPGPQRPEVDLAHLRSRGFEARPGETMVARAAGGQTVVAVGMGEAGRVTAETFRRAAAGLVRAAWNEAVVATTLLSAVPPGLDPRLAAQAVAEGAALAAYRFGRYKADPRACQVESLAVVWTGAGATSAAEVQMGLQRGARLAEAVAFARDLVNEPASAMTPVRLAEIAAEVAEREGLALTVLDEHAIAAEGLGGLMGVAAGSVQPPRLIELVFDPPGAEYTLALVGKGITFDSGGLSIKPADSMETMKIDMSGAAAVLAVMSVLPALAPLVKVVAILPTTENMPGGRATKPGDVLRIRNGKTVEVLNTDAEGRLVLADGLSLAVEAGVDAILDLATLTGACMMALGRRIAGLMGNHEGWMAQVQSAAARSGELVWPLPLPEVYRASIDSDVADLRNIGTERLGGALTAGLFLQEFVAGVPWAHLDIAGPARSEEDDAYFSKGGTGFGVRTVLELIEGFTKPTPAQATPAQATPAANGS